MYHTVKFQTRAHYITHVTNLFSVGLHIYVDSIIGLMPLEMLATSRARFVLLDLLAQRITESQLNISAKLLPSKHSPFISS